MTDTKRLIQFFILSMFMVSCNMPALAILPASVTDIPDQSQINGGTPEPFLPLMVANSTATPTPFQPLPPTAVVTPTALPTLTPFPTSTAQPELSVPDLPVETIPELPRQMTILLLGSDRRPGGAGFRTDTIILLVLNPDQGKVSLLSFPRDLYVYIPGWQQDRINTAFYRGGFKTLAATLQHNFGVKPDHYVLINFRSFKQMIDSLGGLEVKVGQQVTDKYPGKGTITIKKGRQNMNADMVLWYVRTRKTTNDFARNRRQQEILVALFEKLITMDALRRVPEFYKSYKKSVTTDLGLTDALSVLPLAIKVATDPSRINQYYISPQDVWDYITPGGAMVLLPREAQIRKLVKQAMSGK